MQMQNVEIKTNDKNMSEKEVQSYIERFYQNSAHKGKKLTCLELNVEDDDYVGITYHFTSPDFERIRRITGYLVGTMDRWNDAKTIEEQDRVKHSIIK